MFRLIQFDDKSVKPALSSWLILVGGDTKCIWPLNGLEFKLKNLVDPPLEVNIQEKAGWRVVKCDILLHEFATVEEANMAALRITKKTHLDRNAVESHTSMQRSIDEGESLEVENCVNPAKNTDKLESVEALKKRERNVDRREKELEKKLREIEIKEKQNEEKEKEVKELIEEARESIKTEFEAKQLLRQTIQADLDKKKLDLDRKEVLLAEREQKLMEMQRGNVIVGVTDGEKAVEGGQAAIEQNEFEEFSKIREEHFWTWDGSFKRVDMMKFYLNINLKVEKDFIKECIKRTFDEKFIYKIKFDHGSPFNESNFLSVLIATVQSKFADNKYDDKEAKKKIAASFNQFRNTKKKQEQS